MRQLLYQIFTTINSRELEAFIHDLNDRWSGALTELTPQKFEISQIETLWQQPMNLIPRTIWDEFEQAFNTYRSDLSRHFVLYQKSENFDKLLVSLRKLMLKVWTDLCNCIMKQEVAKFEIIVRYE